MAHSVEFLAKKLGETKEINDNLLRNIDRNKINCQKVT